MKSWQTTLGGALSVLGKTLIGVGVLPQLSGTPNKVLLWIAMSGFIIEAVGGFFTALFAADAKSLSALSNRVDANQDAISLTKEAVRTGHTEMLNKPPHNPT